MAEVLRVSLFGSMPNGEEWSVNPVWRIGGDFGVPVTAAQAQTIATAIAAISVPTAMLQSMSNGSTTVTGCRVEARSLTGTLESQAEALKTTPQAGSGTNVHPFQVSLVTSLRTATPGASGRGRLYWPFTGLPLVASTLRPASATMTPLLAAVETYLSDIEAAIEATVTGVSLCVWSRKNGSTANVQTLAMGDVPDVQRRRRDALLELYYTLPYTA